MNYFERIYKRVMEGSVHNDDHYRALRYYLIGSKSFRHFKSEQELGYQQPREPSRHPWLENMRYLLRQFGYDQLIQFLDWCIQRHRHPWRGWIKQFQAEQRRKQASAELSSLSKEEQQVFLRDKKSFSSLTTFARRFKIPRRKLQQLKKDKQLPYPVGWIANKWRGFNVYDLWQLCICFGIPANHPYLKIERV